MTPYLTVTGKKKRRINHISRCGEAWYRAWFGTRRIRRFESCHLDHSTACSDGIFLVTGGFLLFLRLFRGDFCFDFGDHLSQLFLALFPRMRVYVEAFAHQRAPFRRRTDTARKQKSTVYFFTSHTTRPTKNRRLFYVPVLNYHFSCSTKIQLRSYCLFL